MSLSSTYLNVKNLIATNLASKGVSASKNDGLTTLANAILDIEQGGPEIVSFDNLATEFNYTRKRGNNGFSVTIPSGVTTLGDYCFSNCNGLTSVTIPNSVTALGDYCFDGCAGLTSITIPNGVITLGRGCFDSCTGLTSVTIPSDVTTLGATCFYNCSSLTSITIPSNVTSIGNACFNNCSSLTSVTISSSVTSLENGCFNNCSSLTSVTIPNGVRSLGVFCFNGCTGLTSVVIPSSVISLESGCFADCTGLTSVTIPSSVTTLGTNCFKSCSKLVDYQLYWETPPVTWKSTLMPNNADTYFTIPNGTTANYVAKSFPSDKLVEAIFTDNGTTASHNDHWYMNSYGTATVQRGGTKLLNTSGNTSFVMRSIIPSNKTISDANAYSYNPPYIVEFDIVETDGASSSDAQVQIYSDQTTNNFTQGVTTGHYKIEVKEDEQKIWVDDTLIKTTNLSLPNARITLRVRNGKYLIYKNFRVYNMPWGSHIELAATNPYMLTGETTDIVVKLRNGVCRPLTNKNITIGQSVFIDGGTTESHNDSWNVTNGTMTRMDSYTRLVESAPTLMCQMNSGYITPTSTVEFDFKAVDGVTNWGLIYIRNGGGGNSLADLSLNNIGGEIGEWIHLKIVFNNTDTITIYSSKLDTPITKTLSSTDTNYRLLLYCGGANTELHFKNVIVYETINGVTYGNGEFVLHDVSVTDDTTFTATYSSVSATCKVEYCSFVDYATTSNHNDNWSNLTYMSRGTDGTTINNTGSNTLFENIKINNSISPFSNGDFTVTLNILSVTGSDNRLRVIGATTCSGEPYAQVDYTLLPTSIGEFKMVYDSTNHTVKTYKDGTLIQTTNRALCGNLNFNLRITAGSSIKYKDLRIKAL